MWLVVLHPRSIRPRRQRIACYTGSCAITSRRSAPRVRERRLLRDGDPLPLTTRVFETLKVLIARPGRFLRKDELMQHLWPDAVVEENNLNHNISVLAELGAFLGWPDAAV